MRRLLVALLALALLAGALGAVSFERLAFALMTPSGAFDPEASPAAPDYADGAAWSALPDREDAADAAIPEFPAGDQESALVDVFYVHPTSYLGSDWNGPVDDAALNEATDRVATRIQASAFNGCCAVYAPRYRQANGTAFTRASEDGMRAIDVAYGDVADAFRSYLARSGGGRPFVVASHSQGTVMARRLLREEIAGRPLRAKLVAAYLVGAPITRDALASQLPGIPVCASPAQTGCLVSWNARGPEYRPKLEMREIPPPAGGSDPRRRVCVNPISWRDDGEPVPSSRNEGAVFLDADPPLFAPAFASARCAEGTLVVDEIGEAPRDLPSRILDYVMGAGNHHPIEYQIYFVNLRRNARVRAEAWLRSAAAASSAPATARPQPGSAGMGSGGGVMRNALSEDSPET